MCEYISLDELNDLKCRVCLETEDVMVPIFEEVDDGQPSLVTMLAECGGLTVNKDDGLPCYLCRNCIKELLTANHFREKCKKVKLEQNWSNIDLAGIGFDELQVPTEEDTASTAAEAEESTKTLLALAGMDNNSILPLLYVTDEDENQMSEHIESEAVEINDVDAALVETGSMGTGQFQADDVAADEIKRDEESEEFIDAPLGTEDIIIYDEEYENGVEEEIFADSRNSEELQQTDEHQTIETCFTYLCDVCGASFMKPANLRRHMSKAHPLLQCYECDKCHHCFTEMQNYKLHGSSCRKGRRAERLNQDQKPSSVVADDRHKRCPYCSKQLNSLFALNMHVRTHTGERPFSCTSCDKSFKTKAALVTHEKRHAGLAAFKCDICSKSFVESSNLAAHMRIHTGEKPHVCNVCRKRFTRVYLLQLHMRTHTGERPYVCSTCGSGFTQSSDLKYHINNTHQGVRKYSCPSCPKTFCKRSHLFAHMEKHGNADRFTLVEQAAAEGTTAADMLNNLDFKQLEDDTTEPNSRKLELGLDGSFSHGLSLNGNFLMEDEASVGVNHSNLIDEIEQTDYSLSDFIIQDNL